MTLPQWPLLALVLLPLALTACAPKDSSTAATAAAPVQTAPDAPTAPPASGEDAQLSPPSSGSLTTADYLLMNAQALTRFFNGQKPLGLRVSLENGRFLNDVYVYTQPTLSETRSSTCELVAPPGDSSIGLAVSCQPFQVTDNHVSLALPATYSPADFAAAVEATMESFDHWYRVVLKPGRPSDRIVSVKVWHGSEKLYSTISYHIKIDGQIETRMLNHWCHIHEGEMDCHVQKPEGPNEP